MQTPAAETPCFPRSCSSPLLSVLPRPPLLLDSFGGHSATSGKAVETAFHTTFATIGAIAAASSFIFALVDKDKGITRKRKKAA